MSVDAEQERQAWLDSLKPGDEIAYKGTGGYSAWKIAAVDSRTASKCIVVGRYKFSKLGHILQKIDRWDITTPVHCHPVTQEIRDDVRKRSIIEMIHNMHWGNFSVQSLDVIHAEVMREKLRARP